MTAPCKEAWKKELKHALISFLCYFNQNYIFKRELVLVLHHEGF